MIRRNVLIPASTERVWEALTDPDQTRSWFGGELHWDLEPGAPLSYLGDDGETREGLVEEVRRASRLRFVWWGTDGDRDAGASEVTYLLQPAGDGTNLTVQETPLRSSAPQASAPASPGWHEWDTRLASAWGRLSVASRPVARA